MLKIVESRAKIVKINFDNLGRGRLFSWQIKITSLPFRLRHWITMRKYWAHQIEKLGVLYTLRLIEDAIAFEEDGDKVKSCQVCSSSSRFDRCATCLKIDKKTIEQEMPKWAKV